MNNQQLKAHCEDVIANPQDHPDWVVDMARVALASLEAVPVAELYMHGGRYGSAHWCAKESPSVSRYVVYTQPPVPALKPIIEPKYRNSPDMHTKQYYEAIGFNQGLDAYADNIRAAGYEVKS